MILPLIKKVIWFTRDDRYTRKFLEDNNANFIKKKDRLDGSICIINDKKYILLQAGINRKMYRCNDVIVDGRISNLEFRDRISPTLTRHAEVDFY